MSASIRPEVIIVTPYLADANNGNWRTAARWSRLLSPWFRPRLQGADRAPEQPAASRAVALIALHARRSRAAIERWRRARPDAALLVALTGTDLYKDIAAGDTAALASLADADRVIVLQADAVGHVPAFARDKVGVIHQSARTLLPWQGKASDRLHCVLVGHLRAEKDPATALAAWRLLPRDLPVTLTLIGGALDRSLATLAQDAAAADPRVRWLGSRPHAWTRQAIKRAHLLLCPSRMEGGANVVIEAVTAGTPVIGSRISGNVGLLGADYAGYFPAGDATALAALLARAMQERRWLERLAAQCAARAPRFAPEAEQRALVACLRRAIADQPTSASTMPR
jgi:putative glycosyltransferase (TIGR04348 family)